MVVTKMKQAKIKCRECDCWSLTCGIKKKRRGYKTLIHTFTKRLKTKQMMMIIIIIIVLIIITIIIIKMVIIIKQK